ADRDIGKVEITSYVLISQLSIGKTYLKLVECLSKSGFPKILQVQIVSDRCRREKPETIAVFKFGRPVVPAVEFKKEFLFIIVGKSAKITECTPGFNRVGRTYYVPDCYVERIEVIRDHIPLGRDDLEIIILFLLIPQ